MKKRFLSFGNEKFIKSRQRILNEAMELKYDGKQLFDSFKIETEDIINDTEYSKVIDKIPNALSSGRGYYWWTWKPYIIYKNLCEMNDGDILFYCDAGMTIFNNNNTINKFIELFELVSNYDKCKTGIATFITTGNKEKRIEYMYNTLSVFEHFNVENNKNITHTQQIQAGVNIIFKSNKSMEIIYKFYETVLNYPELVICDRRVYPKFHTKLMDGFIDHRHDQSIWSVLVKINDCTILTHNKNPIYQTHCRE
jgi:hypothetical protein